MLRWYTKEKWDEMKLDDSKARLTASHNLNIKHFDAPTEDQKHKGIFNVTEKVSLYALLKYTLDHHLNDGKVLKAMEQKNEAAAVATNPIETKPLKKPPKKASAQRTKEKEETEAVKEAKSREKTSREERSIKEGREIPPPPLTQRQIVPPGRQKSSKPPPPKTPRKQQQPRRKPPPGAKPGTIEKPQVTDSRLTKK